MVYDIRYNVVSSVYRHNMNYPILALATYKAHENQVSPTALVSAGGPNHEVSQLNLDTGIVETLFRCSVPVQDRELCRNDIPTIPEFIHETNFKDNKLGTLRRESNFKQFNRQILASRNHEEFSRLHSDLFFCLFVHLHLTFPIDSHVKAFDASRISKLHQNHRRPQIMCARPCRFD